CQTRSLSLHDALPIFDLKAGEIRFLRPKVDKVQTHKLSAETLRALHAWFDSSDAPESGLLLRGSRKGGALTSTGMSERSITERRSEEHTSELQSRENL